MNLNLSLTLLDVKLVSLFIFKNGVNDGHKVKNLYVDQGDRPDADDR